MTQEELFDIFDDNLEKIGVKPRSQVHRDGDWHRSAHCWLIYRDDQGQDWILVQKRASDKDTYPDLFDISSAGHCSVGETVERTVIRELEEELGLAVAFDDLIYIGLRVGTKKPSPTLIDREINDVFLLVKNQSLTACQPNDEVNGLAQFLIDDGLALCAGEKSELDAIYLARDAETAETISLQLQDFVPSLDLYLYRVLVTAKRCLNGEKYLVI